MLVLKQHLKPVLQLFAGTVERTGAVDLDWDECMKIAKDVCQVDFPLNNILSFLHIFCAVFCCVVLIHFLLYNWIDASFPLQFNPFRAAASCNTIPLLNDCILENVHALKTEEPKTEKPKATGISGNKDSRWFYNCIFYVTKTNIFFHDRPCYKWCICFITHFNLFIVQLLQTMNSLQLRMFLRLRRHLTWQHLQGWRLHQQTWIRAQGIN